MNNILPYLPLGLIVLACPLMMGAMGAGVWVMARARGEKKKLSMGCMMGQCEHEEHASTEGTNVQEKVARLQREVEVLRAQLRPTSGHESVGGARAPVQTLAKTSEEGQARL